MKYFRLLSYFEAASLMVLLLIAMPLKYFVGNPDPVRFAGTIHGVLFLMFVCVSVVFGQQRNWSPRKIMASWVIASVPLGPVFFEKFLFEEAV